MRKEGTLLVLRLVCITKLFRHVDLFTFWVDSISLNMLCYYNKHLTFFEGKHFKKIVELEGLDRQIRHEIKNVFKALLIINAHVPFFTLTKIPWTIKLTGGY